MILPIETDRLVLRRFTRDDIDAIIELVSHPSVAQVGSRIKASESAVEDYVESQNDLQLFELDKCFELGIALKSENRIIGLTGLIRTDDKQGEIGFALNVRYRRSGYALEAAQALISFAFREMLLHRIWADTSSQNMPAIKLLERLGMRREGHHREAKYESGKWVDTYVYAVLVRDWRQSDR